MKKIVILILCFVLLLSGCKSLDKAEPYYTETRDDVTFSTKYEYSFTDESSIRCTWVNSGDESFSFQDVFELHVLGNDGEWYLVSNGKEANFNTDYCHGLDPQSETNSRYDLSLFTSKLDSGKTYRISTYYYDDNGNYYQAFAEFICDNDLAEAELKEASDGLFSYRGEPSEGSLFQILEKNDD